MNDDEDLVMIQYLPEPINARFMGFSSGTSAELAEAIFAARYGVKPQTTIVTSGAVLVGPIPDEGRE